MTFNTTRHTGPKSNDYPAKRHVNWKSENRKKEGKRQKKWETVSLGNQRIERKRAKGKVVDRPSGSTPNRMSGEKKWETQTGEERGKDPPNRPDPPSPSCARLRLLPNAASHAAGGGVFPLLTHLTSVPMPHTTPHSSESLLGGKWWLWSSARGSRSPWPSCTGG